MQPALMLSPVLDLHDARYCAAVGITHLGFRMNGTEDALSPAEVAEILDWLSGPVGIAEFGTEAPHEINSVMAASKCAIASLPGDYDPRLVSSIAFPVVIRIGAADLTLTDWATCLGPDNFLLLPAAMPADSFDKLIRSGVRKEQIIPTVESHAEARGWLESSGGLPYGISLGGFVKGADGRIDYDRCDEFLEVLQSFEAV